LERGEGAYEAATLITAEFPLHVSQFQVSPHLLFSFSNPSHNLNVKNPPLKTFLSSAFKYTARTATVLTKIFRSFPQSLDAKARTVP
jgi:hypothetical protein